MATYAPVISVEKAHHGAEITTTSVEPQLKRDPLHGRLPVVSWPRGARRCERCYRHCQEQTQHLCVGGPQRIQGWQLPATHYGNS